MLILLVRADALRRRPPTIPPARSHTHHCHTNASSGTNTRAADAPAATTAATPTTATSDKASEHPHFAVSVLALLWGCVLAHGTRKHRLNDIQHVTVLIEMGTHLFGARVSSGREDSGVQGSRQKRCLAIGPSFYYFK